MKNIKKGVSKVAAVGLISMLSLGGLSSIAFAAGEEFSDPQEYKNSMTVDGELTVVNHEDTNNDGLITEGDVLSLNLHVENTSDTDYNYVDVSSFGLDLNREFVSDSLPSGESVDYPISYTVKKGDEVYGSAYHNVVVNVRDETRIENSTEFDFFESVDTNVDVVGTSNSHLTGLVMDKDSKNIYVSSIDEYDNYYGIDVSRLEEGYHSVSVGDGYVSGFDFTNDSDETITLDKVEFVNNIIEENISGTVVEPGETVNLYVISEITRDDLDWRLSNAKVSAGGENVVVVSDTNNTNYIIEAGQTSFPGNDMWLNVNGEAVLNEDKEAGSIEITYSFSAEDNSPTIVVDGVNSEEFGYIESNHVLTDSTVVEVAAPETIVLEDGGTFEDTAYVVHRGAYHSLDVFLDTADVWTSYESDSGAGVGDEFPAPTLSNPVCGEEAQVILPQEFIDEYNETHFIPHDRELLTYEVEKQDDNTYYVYAVDWNYPMIMAEWTLEIPEVVPCPVVEVPAPEAPVFVPETCDSDSSVNLPENSEFYRYEQSVIDGVHTVNAILVETGEIAETWSFDVVEATDCAIEPPVVEIPDYEEPVFTAPTCDNPASLETPESNEFYNYFSNGFETADGVGGFTVEVRNAETDEVLDNWEFEYTNPTDCDPVVEIPDYEVPTFVAPTCDDDANLTVPDNNEFYNYFSNGVVEAGSDIGVYEVSVSSVETGETLDTWVFEYNIPTDCDPVVEIPEPEVPVFVPATCDDSASVEVPDRNEFYEYTAISVIDPEGYGQFEVFAVSVETGENVGNWTFDIVPATDCDPVVPEVPETPEPPVEEEVVPPVINDPKPPVKVDSGEVSEVNADNNNVAVFALIAGVGALVALAAGGVLVRSRNK